MNRIELLDVIAIAAEQDPRKDEILAIAANMRTMIPNPDNGRALSPIVVGPGAPEGHEWPRDQRTIRSYYQLLSKRRSLLLNVLGELSAGGYHIEQAENALRLAGHMR